MLAQEMALIHRHIRREFRLLKWNFQGQKKPSILPNRKAKVQSFFFQFVLIDFTFRTCESSSKQHCRNWSSTSGCDLSIVQNVRDDFVIWPMRKQHLALVRLLPERARIKTSKLSTQNSFFFDWWRNKKKKFGLLFGPQRISLKQDATLSFVLIKFVNVKNVSQRINSLSLGP